MSFSFSVFSMPGDLTCQVGVQLLNAAFADFKISCYNYHHFNLTRLLSDMKFSFAEARAMEMCEKMHRVRMEIEGTIMTNSRF